MKNLFQRRRLLLYLGLGSLSAGAAALLQHQVGRREFVEKLEIWRSPAANSLPDLMALPEFQGIAQWLNSQPLSVADLKGQVVLIQFWTFACINCQRTLPYLTQWHQQYAAQGLKVIGVHTPEFAFEREVRNIQAALEQYQITYPVPIDNDYQTWKAYKNRYWPHLFLADRQGVVRYHHIGEGAYEQTEQTIQQLLS